MPCKTWNIKKQFLEFVYRCLANGVKQFFSKILVYLFQPKIVYAMCFPVSSFFKYRKQNKKREFFLQLLHIFKKFRCLVTFLKNL